MVLPEADVASDLLCRFFMRPGELTVAVSVNSARDVVPGLRQLRVAGAHHAWPPAPRPTRGRRVHDQVDHGQATSVPASDMDHETLPDDGAGAGRPRRASRSPGCAARHSSSSSATRTRPAPAATPPATLVHLHLPLVEHCARRFRNRGEPFEDLVEVGTIGLIKSIDRFESDRGVEFSTYATPTIIGEIKRYFRDKGWAIRVPRRLEGCACRSARRAPS